MWQYNHTDELYHWGVPGMKWGRRKAKSTTSTSTKVKKVNNQRVTKGSMKAIDKFYDRTYKNTRRKNIGMGMAMTGAALHSLAKKAIPTNKKQMLVNKGSRIAGASLAAIGGGMMLYAPIDQYKNIKENW